MTGKTRRKINRFWRIIFPVYGGVISIGSLIVSFLIKPLVETSAAFSKLQMHFPGWYLLICFWFIVIVVLYIISDLLSHNRSKASVSEINYFKEINFGKLGENTILKVINGLLDAEKVEPFYVHAAPKSKEVETVYSRLNETDFVMISGRPGEGKSMVTYHSAYRFKEEERYYIYRLKVELLEDKTGKEIIDEILFQLDDLKGKKKLIIVDDAHKLAIKQDINIILQQEAEEGHGKYIWVETEFYEEKQAELQPDMYIRVDFQEFFENLLKNFYQSQDPFFQKALKGRIEGLGDAINRVKKGKIYDVWWFAFVASQGEKRLAQEIDNLTDPQMLVLFLISAYTVLNGESELSINYLLNKLGNLKQGWLTEALRISSFSDVIRLLQEQTQVRKSMIRVYDKSERDRGYIASLHYNFARTVIRASLLRTHLVEELLSSVGELLTSEYHKCAYIGIFLNDIGSYAASFDRKNKDWLISFVNNILPEKLQYYPRILKGIKSVAIEIYDEIIRKVDIDAIAENVNSTEAGLFHKLAHLLDVIGDRRNELIKKLDLEQLSKTANSAEIGQFSHLAHLLAAIGDRRNELIKKLDLKQLSQTADSAEILEFAHLVYLLNAIGDRRNELIKKLDLKQLSKTADSAEILEFAHLANFLDAIGDRRNELIKKLDLKQLSKTADSAEIGQFSHLAHLLDAIGDRRNELIKKLDLEQLSKTADSAEIGQFDQLAHLLDAIGDRRNELIEKLDLEQLSKTADSAEIGQFSHLAHLLDAIGDRRNKLIEKLDLEQLSKTADSAEIGQFDQLAHLLNAIGDRRNKLIEKLDLEQLSKTADSAEIGQFSQLAHLLNAIGDRRNKLIEKLDLVILLKVVNSAKVEQFSQVANLLVALGDNRNKLIEEMDLKMLAKAINTAEVNEFEQIAKLLDNLGFKKSQFSKLLDHDKLVQKANQAISCDIIVQGLTMFIAKLEEKDRGKFIQEVDWCSICQKFPIYVYLFIQLGASLGNLLKKAEKLSDKTIVRKVAQHLRSHVNKIKQEVRKAKPKHYSGVAKFLWNCNQIDPVLAKQIASETMSKLAQGFSVKSINYRSAGQLINAFYDIDPNLSSDFVKNDMVRRKIQQSINMDDWSKKIEGLKHLIKAFYRSAPDLWKKILNEGRISIDLNSLDLKSIYREVDEEKNVGTAHNTT